MPDKVLDFISITDWSKKALYFNLSQCDADYAYRMGFDFEMNGTNTTNCHFSIFSSKANIEAWQKGRKDASKKKTSDRHGPAGKVRQ